MLLRVFALLLSVSALTADARADLAPIKSALVGSFLSLPNGAIYIANPKFKLGKKLYSFKGDDLSAQGACALIKGNVLSYRTSLIFVNDWLQLEFDKLGGISLQTGDNKLIITDLNCK